MPIRKPGEIPSGQITDPGVYFNRRALLRAGLLAASTLSTAAIYRRFNRAPVASVERTALGNILPATDSAAGFVTDEARTPLLDITHYNNFYEFSTNKEDVADVAADFVSRPWTVTVDGLCLRPGRFDLDDLRKFAPLEERVYRMRCVEGWSMVIPWDGFPLARLLDRVQPTASARYVAFQTLFDPNRMPYQRVNILRWPYVEGLRMDEAMHPLTMLALGIYGRELPPQDGAPVRLVVPWKYGFKGIKSIVKITLTAQQPRTSWSEYAPNEYGFYANVNPNVDHPRWSQATERRLGRHERIQPTLPFNGYAEQVAGLYRGMDLRANF